jgi:hypothetical protein
LFRISVYLNDIGPDLFLGGQQRINAPKPIKISGELPFPQMIPVFRIRAGIQNGSASGLNTIRFDHAPALDSFVDLLIGEAVQPGFAEIPTRRRHSSTLRTQQIALSNTMPTYPRIIGLVTDIPQRVDSNIDDARLLPGFDTSRQPAQETEEPTH